MHPALKLTAIFLFILTLLLPAGRSFAYDVQRPEVAAFIDEMVAEHDMNRAWLNSLLRDASYKQSIIDAISRPAEKTLEWHEYRKIFLTSKRIDAGVRFWQEQQDTLAGIAAETGVPEKIIVAILGVETFYGRITGNYRVLDALATLAFDYPPRAKFFRSELTEFLLLAQEEQLDPLVPTGSYAGAMGSPQFISSSYRNYAVDGGGDGRRDLWNSWPDVMASVANYFKRHGWRSGEPIVARVAEPGSDAQSLLSTRAELASTILELRRSGIELNTELDNGQPAMLFSLEGDEGALYWVGFRNFYVITRYNRSLMYAMAVKELADEIAARMDETLAAN